MTLVHLEDHDLWLGKEQPGLCHELECHCWERLSILLQCSDFKLGLDCHIKVPWPVPVTGVTVIGRPRRRGPWR